MRLNVEMMPAESDSSAAQPQSSGTQPPLSHRPQSRRVIEPLPFLDFAQIRVQRTKPWLIKGVIAKGETSSWIGAPGKGKSALLTDLAVHVASGRDWRGYRSKGRFGVIYLAVERCELLLRRFEAYKLHFGTDSLPIAIVTMTPDLSDHRSTDILVATIKHCEAHFGIPIGLLIIDTFPKALAASNGDENSAKDQNRVLGIFREVQRLADVHIALVGHTGKEEKRGIRGSNAQIGDVDLMTEIQGEETKCVIVTKANDQREGAMTAFTLTTYSFGLDEDGDPITTSFVSAEQPNISREHTLRKAQRMPSSQLAAIEVLRQLLEEDGVEATGDSAALNAGVVALDRWKAALFSRGILKKQSANPRADFVRLRDGLVRRGLLAIDQDLVRLLPM